MYYLIIWDECQAAAGQDGNLNKIELPIYLAYLFFKLDSADYPSLSSLCFDDYDYAQMPKSNGLLRSWWMLQALDQSIRQ